MEKPNLIIFTVGISLLMGNKEAYENVRGSVKRELRSLTVNEESIKKGLNIKNSSYDRFFDILLNVNPNDEINKRGPGYDPENDPDYLPAELSSLYLFYFTPENIPDSIPSKDKEPKDKVALLYSPDNKCIFCAYSIKKYLTTIFSGMIDGVEMLRIDGLDPMDKEKFEREGVRELLGEISQLIRSHEDAYNIILNVTGGYKGAVPYLTLFGMCQERIGVIYLFEESKANITLPKMPVAFDIFTWRNYRGFIEAVPHLESEVAETILDEILPAQIGGLFEKGEKEYHLTKLGGILKGQYDEEKEGELTPYGRGYLLTDKIKNDGKQKELRDCINRWQYLWLGDLIPETVEHARGHTQRVLELAAQILYPILNEEKNFFGDKDQTDNNLLALISAIWLHDLGHSGDYLKCKQDETTIRDVADEETGSGIIEYDIKGFPSQVRDMHHILSWYLIGKDRVELFDNSAFDDELIEAVRQICLYHRGKMPALENHKPFEHIGIEIKEPLENLRSTKVNLSLLGTLLRIADGGDVQEERTISENYKDMRFLQNRRELEQLEQEEREYREKVDALFDVSLSSQLPEHLAELKNVTCEYFRKDSTERDNQYEKIANMVDDCVQKYIGGEGLECIVGVRKVILRNWLSALDQYVFKKSPVPHFEKHAGISAVMYLLDETEEGKAKNEYHYKVLVIHKKDKVEKKMEELIENAERVLKDIFCEYKKVEKILNAHRIYFDSYERIEEGENGERKPVQLSEKDC